MDLDIKCCELEEKISELETIDKAQSSVIHGLNLKLETITEALDTSHKVYDNLLKDYMKLKEKLADAEKVIAFYGDPKNWDWENNDMSDDYSLIDYAEHGTKIFRCKKGEGQWEDLMGGKRAREYKEKYRVVNSTTK